MLAAILYWNYFYRPSQAYLQPGFATSYFTYLIPFLTTYLLQPLYFKNTRFFKSRWFWIIVFTAPCIFAWKVHAGVPLFLLRKLFNGDEMLFWIYCSKWLTGVIVTLFPVFLVWKIKERNRVPFYGINKTSHTAVYFLCILCMVPLIAIAATRQDFLHTYPRVKIVDQLNLHPPIFYYAVFEVFYALDFFSIEIFFRGFLILAMLRYCGAQAVIPAACFYCCIHLGKPIAEAISSFAGGILLGIVSLNTNSIYGGLIIHLGIAWLMEIGALIAHQLY